MTHFLGVPYFETDRFIWGLIRKGPVNMGVEKAKLRLIQGPEKEHGSLFPCGTYPFSGFPTKGHPM